MAQGTIKYTQYGKAIEGLFLVDDGENKVDLSEDTLHANILRDFAAYHDGPHIGHEKCFTYYKNTGRREMEYLNTSLPLGYLVSPVVSNHVVVFATYWSWGATVRIYEQVVPKPNEDSNRYRATINIEAEVPEHATTLELAESFLAGWAKLMAEATNKGWISTEMLSDVNIVGVTGVEKV